MRGYANSDIYDAHISDLVLIATFYKCLNIGNNEINEKSNNSRDKITKCENSNIFEYDEI